MASSLTADSFFNLSTQHQSNNYNKELIFVKLTDSALRAIEEFVKNQVGTNPKPSTKSLIKVECCQQVLLSIYLPIYYYLCVRHISPHYEI
jgi:RNA polymerase II elongation factor ELL